jgi:hypothetical protein
MRRHLALAAASASLVACALLVLAPAVPASKGGNSANAKRCQKGGYKDWVRADQTPFKNAGQCVRYAARGGTLTEPTPPEDRAFCAPTGPPILGQCSVPGRLDLDFDASSGPLSENPMGTILWESLPNSWVVQVTCLQVTGNRASVGGAITASSFPEDIGMGLAFTVVDNTPPTPDLIDFADFPDILLPAPPAANTPACGDTRQPTDPVTGDIVVQDN